MDSQKENPLALFGLERSVYTRIARLAIEEKGVLCTLEEVKIFGADGVPAEHFARHPFGRIPVLQHGDFSLYETGAITRYVDEAFPGSSLQPQDPILRARMNQVIGLLDAYAYRPMVWGVFVQRISVPQSGGAPDENKIQESLQSAETGLKALDRLLGSAAFFAGECISLADLHALPILHYFCLAPEGYALLRTHPELLRWYDAMLSRGSVSRIATPFEVLEP